MEDTRWLRLMTIGLVLAALAVGYFLMTGRLISKSATRTQQPQVKGVQTPTPTPIPTPTNSPAYDRIVNRVQGGVQALPGTGFPAGLAIVFSVSAIISGWSLRKFPN